MNREDILEVNGRKGSWGKILAYVDVKFQCGLTLKGVKVRDDGKGIWVQLPTLFKKDKQTGKLDMRPCCEIADKEDNQTFKDIILQWFNGHEEAQPKDSPQNNTSTASFFSDSESNIPF
jgi:DNA-binding cell septation regulator SpoVG